MSTDISRPTRGISRGDVMFLLSVAFIFFALVVSVAISRPDCGIPHHDSSALSHNGRRGSDD